MDFVRLPSFKGRFKDINTRFRNVRKLGCNTRLSDVSNAADMKVSKLDKLFAAVMYMEQAEKIAMLMPVRAKKPSILDIGSLKPKKPYSPPQKRNSIHPPIEKLNMTIDAVKRQPVYLYESSATPDLS